MKTVGVVAFMTLFTSLLNLAILIAVGAKLQVAKEDYGPALQQFAANPVNSILALLSSKKGE